MELFINADDFGLSPGVNRAIVDAFARGLITGTTALANAPAFEEACALAHQHGLLDAVGIHFVLTDDEPLTDPIRRLPRFCGPDGRFCYVRPGNPLFVVSAEEREALGKEFVAQVQRCRAAGLPIVHCDSHHHVHNEWPIFAIVRQVARQEGIRSCRLARNCGAGIRLPHRLYKAALNARIRASGLARTRHFGGIDDVLDLASRGRNLSAEVMVHPIYEGEVILDGCDGEPLEAGIARLTRSLSPA